MHLLGSSNVTLSFLALLVFLTNHIRFYFPTLSSFLPTTIVFIAGAP